MLAYYSGHLTILKAVFVVSGLLLLVLPVSAAWYLLASFKKKRKNKPGLQDRITKSSFGGALFRLFRFLNSPIWIGSQISLCVFAITLAIVVIFPQSPRVSLAIIVVETVVLVYLMIASSLRWLENQIKELWKFNDKTVDAITAIADALKDHKDSILSSFDALQEQNQFTEATLLHVVDTLKVLHEPTPPPNQIDAAREEKEEPPES